MRCTFKRGGLLISRVGGTDFVPSNIPVSFPAPSGIDSEAQLTMSLHWIGGWKMDGCFHQ